MIIKTYSCSFRLKPASNEINYSELAVLPLSKKLRYKLKMLAIDWDLK